MQALLGYHNESRWIRYARKAIVHLFPHLPKQPGYNMRLRALSTQLAYFIAALVTDTDLWRHPIRAVEVVRRLGAVDVVGVVAHVGTDGDGGQVGQPVAVQGDAVQLAPLAGIDVGLVRRIVRFSVPSLAI